MDGVSALVVMYLPTILMLIVGFVLLVVEMYIPGFGAPGIVGLLLLIGGIIMAKPTPFQALIMVLVIVALLLIALTISIHSASKGRLSRSKLVLHDVATQAQTRETNELMELTGRAGVARTALRPAGIAEFDGEQHNVVSEGSFILEGAAVQVARVEGNRIVVRPIKTEEGET
ncbi:MAG: NfeD family protein [Christensenellales bacterium]|jgi:membrane-bound ClpP family serine protease